MTDVPPQDQDAERYILGACLLTSSAIEACEFLDAADFYLLSHGRIWQEIQKMHDAGEPVDLITLGDRLEGQRPVLAELAKVVPATANAGHYARIVRDKAVLRSLGKAGTEVSALQWSDKEGDELVEEAERIVYGLRSHDRDNVPLADELKTALAGLRHLAAHPRGVLGVPSGFPDLDRVTQGWEPGRLVVVAGRPSMGKTAMALCAAGHAAVSKGIPTAFFSLEMSRPQLVHRLLALMANVEGQRLRNPWKLGLEEWGRIEDAAQRLAEAPLTIDDDGLLRPGTLRRRVRRLKAKQGLGLVFVDYLQLMAGDTRNREFNKVQEVTEISRALKVCAKEFDVPVIALAQLSRAVEQRPDKRPVLSDLRDSGAIEQDADQVLFLYRPSYYDPQSDPGVVEVNVAKNRDGETAMVPLAWVASKAKVANLLREAA